MTLVRAYGSDRLKEDDGGLLVLSCRLPKPGWIATTPRTLTTAEFPGSCVVWDDQQFEIIEAVQLDHTRVRYTLRAWREENAIRHMERYDQDSERQRLIEHRRELKRERNRKSANLLGMFVGHLPAIVQDHLASEYGTLPSKLTLLSFIPTLILVIALLGFIVGRIQAELPVPAGPQVLLAWLAIESAIRFLNTWTQGRPIGSSAGFLTYVVWYLAHPRRSDLISPFAEPKGLGLYKTEAPPELAAIDAFSMREPLVTLLSAEEQERMAKYFPYSYKRSSRTVAFLLLVTALAGAASSLRLLAAAPRFSAFVSLVVAGGIALEQVVRLAAFRHGPKGSVLAFLVRPFLRHLGI